MRVILSIVIALAIAITFHSCSKSANTNTAQADSAYMKATIQGLPFSATGASGAYAGSVSSGGVTTLTIYGVAANGQAVTIALINSTGGGITQFATGNGSADYYPSGGLQGSYSYAVSGSVNISAISPNLVGTFSFKTSDIPSETIANGSFSVPAP